MTENCWIKTADIKPTESGVCECQVLTATRVSAFGRDWVIYELPYAEVVGYQRDYTYWMPLPKFPGVEG